MILGILPLFIVTNLGAPKAVLGGIEGSAELISYTFRMVSGSLSDRLGKRKIFVLAGYALSTIGKLFFAVSTGWFDVRDFIRHSLAIKHEHKMMTIKKQIIFICYHVLSFLVLRDNEYISIMSMTMIIIITSVIVVFTLIEIGKLSIAQGQLNHSNISSSSLLAPEQKAAICSSVGSHINTTESRICGIPMTPSSNTTSSENATTMGGIPSSYEGE